MWQSIWSHRCVCHRCCSGLEDVVHCDQEHFKARLTCLLRPDDPGLVWITRLWFSDLCCSLPRKWHSFGILSAGGLWHTWGSLGKKETSSKKIHKSNWCNQCSRRGVNVSVPLTACEGFCHTSLTADHGSVVIDNCGSSSLRCVTHTVGTS